MMLFIITFVICFIIGRKIQEYKIQKMTDQMVELEHQKQMLQTRNPFWMVLPEANQDKTNENK